MSQDHMKTHLNATNRQKIRDLLATYCVPLTPKQYNDIVERIDPLWWSLSTGVDAYVWKKILDTAEDQQYIIPCSYILPGKQSVLIKKLIQSLWPNARYRRFPNEIQAEFFHTPTKGILVRFFADTHQALIWTMQAYEEVTNDNTEDDPASLHAVCNILQGLSTRITELERTMHAFP